MWMRDASASWKLRIYVSGMHMAWHGTWPHRGKSQEKKDILSRPVSEAVAENTYEIPRSSMTAAGALHRCDATIDHAMVD